MRLGDASVLKKSRQELAVIKPYVPGKPIEEVQEELGISDIIKLASNENPLGPSLKAQEALVKFVTQAHLYPDGSCTALKKSLAAHWHIQPEQLIIGNGSDEILKFIAEAFLQPGDEVVLAEPTFSEYHFVSQLMGAALQSVPCRQFIHDLPAMAAAVNDRTKIVFVCNPNNPTGTAVGHAELQAFMDKIPDDVLVVIDEAYYEYVQRDDFPDVLPWLAQRENVLITRTFSKAHGLAALRIGYGIGHPNLIRILEKTREPFNVNAAAQAAARASLADLDHIAASVDVNEVGKSYLYEQFAALELDYVPTETNFILVDVGHPAAEVFDRLLRKGVIIRPAHVFGLPTFIRVTVGTPSENQRFVAALKEVIAGESSH